MNNIILNLTVSLCVWMPRLLLRTDNPPKPTGTISTSTEAPKLGPPGSSITLHPVFSIEEQEEFFFLQARAQEAQLQAEHSTEYTELRIAQQKVEELQKKFEALSAAKEMRTNLEKFQKLVEDRRKKCSSSGFQLQASPEGKPICTKAPDPVPTK